MWSASSPAWSPVGNNLYKTSSSGNVGIGTSSPGGKLTVQHNSSLSSPQLLLHEPANDYARLNFTNNTASSYWTVAGQPASSSSTARLNFYYSSYGDIMSIRGDGRVGIRTLSPIGQLDVRGTLEVRSQIRGRNSSGQAVYWHTISSGGAGYFETYGPNGNTNFRITAMSSSANRGQCE